MSPSILLRLLVKVKGFILRYKVSTVYTEVSKKNFSPQHGTARDPQKLLTNCLMHGVQERGPLSQPTTAELGTPAETCWCARGKLGNCSAE